MIVVKVLSFLFILLSFTLSAQIISITTTSRSSAWAPSNVVKSGQPLIWEATAAGMVTQTISLPGSEKFDLSVSRSSDVIISVTSSDGVSGFTELNLNSLEITNLNTSQSINLKKLSCSSNLINILDVTKNKDLTGLFCSSNQLSSLILNSNTKLEKLSCFFNKISSLDLSNNGVLSSLSCGSNNLTDLDLSNNSNLKVFDCSSSELLSGLNVKNGNNTIIESFNTIGNNKLFCIQVDNVTYSEASWKDIDSWTKFNIDCTFINDPPIANDDFYSVKEDEILIVDPPGVLENDSDPEENDLTAILIDDVGHGNLIFNNNGSFTYTPDNNFYEIDFFTYKANDGELDSNIATVTIEVKPVNDAPIASDNSFIVLEDETLNVDTPGVLENDTDSEGNGLTAILVENISQGNLVFNNDGSFSYTPNNNFTGTDSFTYKANDGALDSNIATVTIEVNAVNDPPIANDNTFTVSENDILNVDPPGVLENDIDPDGDVLNAILSEDVKQGTLVLNNNGSFTYTPNVNYSGTDFFTYKANDGKLDSNTATVNLEVVLVNEPPVANDLTYETNENTLLDVDKENGVLSNDTDSDEDPLTAILVTDVSNGNLSLHPDGSFTYIPDLDFFGKDSFTYKANDGNIDSNEAGVDIKVQAGKKIMIPNAFTPNADGHNDFFKPKFKGMESVRMAIFDTWSNMIYLETGLEIRGWDGMINGKYAENGNYLYVISAKSIEGEKTEYKGLFTLIR